ncbi:hypothetical protein BGZ67_001068 [Mortierella alpina]|nr:hypothetical protein BGZ67_001068 [Mortierella alpina]
MQRVVFVQTRVLDQSSINKAFPIRMWPSQERLMQGDERCVRAIESAEASLKATTATKNGPATLKEQWSTSRKDCRLLFKGLLPGSAAAAAASRSSSNNDTSVIPEGSIPLSSIPSACHGTRLDATEQACGLEGPQDFCCSICLAEYLYEDRLRILPCGHEYHADYIWLMYKSTQCPLCKRDLLEDVGTSPPASTWPATPATVS